jgi:multicomponent Na+:H+ antiporter subunit D
MSWYLSLPLILPFVTAIICYLLRDRAIGAWISVAGSTLGLVAAVALMALVLDRGVVAGQMGNWPAPFGITLVADLLSAVMVLITAITALAVAVYALSDVDARHGSLGYHALFNLYVWFEVMLIASFGLLILNGGKAQIDAGVKYVALNLISTILFLTGIGLLYGQTGTLNFADLALKVELIENQALLTVIAMMFMVAFGVKAAAFPLFFWLPAAYHTPSFSVSAVFAGLLTKVGVYALMRMFTLVFDHDIAYTHTILLWVACFTMVTGVLGAAAQSDFRKILSFHIISQIGYMILGLAIYTPLALVGAVFYLVHHIIVEANLFLIAGISQRLTGGSDVFRIGGLYKSSPFLALLFLIPAFSLAGFPPLSGFWAKYIIVKASLDEGLWVVAFLALAVGLMTIYSMTKIWAEAFWKPHPDGIEPKLAALPGRSALLVPVIALALLTMVIGLMPEPFVQFAERSADQLLDPSAYITAVLGEGAIAAPEADLPAVDDLEVTE